ncbi:hypothetical protein ABIE41_001487 [Bosea sp. OAE506]|uniref:hypothetical protein n=1 Tax=Bosea sp. OAE506 TaxID=2663870 RepID=UPI0017892FAF
MHRALPHPTFPPVRRKVWRMDDEPKFHETEEGKAEAAALAAARLQDALAANEHAEARLPAPPDPMSIPFWTMPMVVGWVMSRDMAFVATLARRKDAELATVSKSAAWDRIHGTREFVADFSAALQEVVRRLLEGRIRATTGGDRRTAIEPAEWQDLRLVDSFAVGRAHGVYVLDDAANISRPSPSIARDEILRCWPVVGVNDRGLFDRSQDCDARAKASVQSRAVFAQSISTLPDGYIWLEDAFERAWLEIEGGNPPSENAPVPDFGPGWVTGYSKETDAKRTSSRERVERQMREALSSGELRAMIQHPQTGEPGEVPKRHLWIDAPRAFEGLGLETEVHHLICPGPDTKGLLVSVQEKELRAFIASRKTPAAAKATPARKRTPTRAEIEACLAAHDGVLKGVRDTREWFRQNAPECSRNSVDAVHNAHAGGRRPGPNNR